MSTPGCASPRRSLPSLRLVLQAGYLEKLFSLFQAAEDLEDVQTLHQLHEVFRKIGAAAPCFEALRQRMAHDVTRRAQSC